MIRSRTRQIKNEEIPSKFFYEAEKQNQNKKNITKLQNKNREIKTEDKEILKIAKEFTQILTKKRKQMNKNKKFFLI